MILLLQTKKLKHMGVKNLVQGHTAEKCQCQGSSPDSLAPGSMLFPTLLHPSHPWPGKKQPLYVNDEKPGSPSQPQPLIYPSILCLSLCLWRILLLVGKQSISLVFPSLLSKSNQLQRPGHFHPSLKHSSSSYFWETNHPTLNSLKQQQLFILLRNLQLAPRWPFSPPCGVCWVCLAWCQGSHSRCPMHTVGKLCQLLFGSSARALGQGLQFLSMGCLGFPTAWWLVSRRTRCKCMAFYALASEVTWCHFQPIASAVVVKSLSRVRLLVDCSPPGSSVHGIPQGRNTGVDFHSLLQGIFLTQGSNPDLLLRGQILHHLSH